MKAVRISASEGGNSKACIIVTYMRAVVYTLCCCSQANNSRYRPHIRHACRPRDSKHSSHESKKDNCNPRASSKRITHEHHRVRGDPDYDSLVITKHFQDIIREIEKQSTVDEVQCCRQTHLQLLHLISGNTWLKVRNQFYFRLQYFSHLSSPHPPPSKTAHYICHCRYIFHPVSTLVEELSRQFCCILVKAAQIFNMKLF